MAGLTLFDELSRAARSLPYCCAASLNRSANAQPKLPCLSLDLRPSTGEGVSISIACDACGRTTRLRVDRERSTVESVERTPAPSAGVS